VAAGRQALERDRTAWTPGTTALFCRFMEAGSKEDDLQLLHVLARANDPTALKYAEGLRSDPFLGAEAAYVTEAVNFLRAPALATCSTAKPTPGGARKRWERNGLSSISASLGRCAS